MVCDVGRRCHGKRLLESQKGQTCCATLRAVIFLDGNCRDRGALGLLDTTEFNLQ